MKYETITIAFPNIQRSPIGGVDVPIEMLPSLIKDHSVEKLATGQYVFTEQGQARIREAECPDFDVSMIITEKV